MRARLSKSSFPLFHPFINMYIEHSNMYLVIRMALNVLTKMSFGFCFVVRHGAMRSVARTFSCAVFKYVVDGRYWLGKRQDFGWRSQWETGRTAYVRTFLVYLVYAVCATRHTIPHTENCVDCMQPSSNKSVWQMLERQVKVSNDRRKQKYKYTTQS